MANQREDRPTRRERKNARRALTALLRRLRASCGAIGTVGDWYDLAGDVEHVLIQHDAAIPARAEARIREALRLPEATLAGVQQACSVLSLELERAAALVGAAPAAGPVLLAGLALVAVAVGVLTVIANATAVDVRVFNQGCDPVVVSGLPLGGTPLLRVAGITLPAQPIVDGGNGVISLPPVRLDVEGRPDTGQMIVRGLERLELPLALGRATDISFDGQSLLGGPITLDLGRLDGRAEHELIITCTG